MTRRAGGVPAAAATVAAPAPAPAKRQPAAPQALAAAGVPRYLPRAVGADPHVAGAVATARHGSGTPLPDALRGRFEAGLHGDFGAVRVHADAAAAVAAHGVGARAYTVGRDIVFGAGQYAPHSAAGRRLLAHELVHVTQQGASGEALQRDDLPGATPVPAGQLASETEAVRKSLKFDTDVVLTSYSINFGLKGSLDTPANVHETVDWDCPRIDAVKDKAKQKDLFQGLRSYAHGVFDLHAQGGDGKNKDDAAGTRLNLVHIADLDLTAWGGPNASYRFSAVGSNKKGKITVHIRVEEMALQSHLGAAADAPAIETNKAAPNGLTHDASVDAALWTRVLRGLDKVSAPVLARVGATTFTMSGDARGPKNEAAEFGDSRPKGATTWTRTITLYQDIVKAGDAEFAFTLAHEIAHGAAYAPTQGASGRLKGALHDSPGFLAAAKKDGGRARAVTDYGGTDAAEFFAECYAMYVQQPQTLLLLRPAIHAWFVQFDAPPAAPATP